MSGKGASFRDMFAHSAPSNIPDWFKPSDMPAKPSEVLHPDVLFGVYNPENEDDSDEIRAKMYEYYDFKTNTWNDQQYLKDTGVQAVPHEFKNAVEIQYNAYIIYLQELEVWQLDYDKERYFQWRWYYADEMLIERLGGNIS